MRTEYKVELPFTSQMSVDVAYRNITIAARALSANAETHENLVQSLGVVREQMIALASLQAEYSALYAEYTVLCSELEKPDAVEAVASVDAHTVQ